ncbi:MAG: hypothetical protein M1829_004847 [Trizodia sp. TS-e1964]|nr:MAG: hypothetical protein M1829_004847 [Trizodia sp. TS-e1964]
MRALLLCFSPLSLLLLLLLSPTTTSQDTPPPTELELAHSLPTPSDHHGGRIRRTRARQRTHHQRICSGVPLPSNPSFERVYFCFPTTREGDIPSRCVDCLLLDHELNSRQKILQCAQDCEAQCGVCDRRDPLVTTQRITVYRYGLYPPPVWVAPPKVAR